MAPVSFARGPAPGLLSPDPVAPHFLNPASAARLAVAAECRQKQLPIATVQARRAARKQSSTFGELPSRLQLYQGLSAHDKSLGRLCRFAITHSYGVARIVIRSAQRSALRLVAAP